MTDRQKKFTDIGAVFRSISSKDQVLRFSLMNYFPRKNLWSLEHQFLKPCKSFMPKVRNFRDQTQKQKKVFLKTCHLFRKIFWRQKLHFWQPSHNNARQKRKKNRHSKSENISKKSVYWSNFHLGKKHAILKIVSKNKTNSFILFRSRPEINQKVLFFVP